MNEKSLLKTQLKLIKNQQAIEQMARLTPPPAPPRKRPRIQPAGNVLVDQMARAELATARRSYPTVKVRSAMTNTYRLPQEHPWAFARAGLTDWIDNPALAGVDGTQYLPVPQSRESVGNYMGLGSTSAKTTVRRPPTPARWLIAKANAVVTPLPTPIQAAIDKSPLSSKQKATLKEEPLSFFVVLADFSEDLLLEFIRRVQRFPGAKPAYVMGGKFIRIEARKGANAARTAAEFLTVCNRNPVAAIQVATRMIVELGTDAALMTGAAAMEVANIAVQGAQTVSQVAGQTAAAAQKAAEQAAQQAAAAAQTAVQTGTQAAKDAAEAAQKTAEQTAKAAGDAAKTVASWFGLGSFGEAVSAGAAAAGTAKAKTAGAVSIKSILGLVKAGIALANIVVPPLLAIATGKQPSPPTNQQKQQTINDTQTQGALADQAIQADSQALDFAQQAEGRILGLPRNVVVYGGAGLAVLGLGALALRSRKKRR